MKWTAWKFPVSVVRFETTRLGGGGSLGPNRHQWDGCIGYCFLKNFYRNDHVCNTFLYDDARLLIKFLFLDTSDQNIHRHTCELTVDKRQAERGNLDFYLKLNSYWWVLLKSCIILISQRFLKNRHVTWQEKPTAYIKNSN